MRIRIEGAEHEIPDVESFTLDESGILFDYTGITLDTYYEANPMNPRLHQAWLHIILRRTQPELTDTQVRSLVRDTKHLSIFAPNENESAAGDADPPDIGRPLTGSSGWPENTGGNTTRSGNDGANGGVPSPEPSPPASSGPPPSAPMSPSATSGYSPPGSWMPATT